MKEKFSGSIVLTIFNYISTFFAFYFLFLALDLKIVGTFTYLNSIISLGFIFYDLGFTNIHYRYSTEENYHLYFDSYFFIKIMLLLINILLSFILITILNLWSSIYLTYLLIYLSSMIILSLSNILIINLKSQKRILISEISFSSYYLIKNTFIIYLSFNVNLFIDPLIFLYLTDLIAVTLLLILLIYFSKKDILRIHKPKKEIIVLYIKDTKYITLRAIIFIIVTNLGNLLLNDSYGPTPLAYINLINQILSVLLAISLSMVPLYLSIYSEYFKNKNISLIEKTSHLVEKYSSILFLSLIIVILLNGKTLLSIFLPNYLNAFSALSIMIFIPYFIGINRPFEYQLISGKKQNLFAISGILIYIIQLILMFILIPKQFLSFNMAGLSTVGYGLAFTIPWGIYIIICHYFTKKNFNIKFQKDILFHGIFAFFALLLAYLVKDFILIQYVPNQILIIVLSTILLLSIFFCELMIFKQLKRTDLRFFLELLEIKRYKKSLKSEFEQT